MTSCILVNMLKLSELPTSIYRETSDNSLYCAYFNNIHNEELSHYRACGRGLHESVDELPRCRKRIQAHPRQENMESEMAASKSGTELVPDLSRFGLNFAPNLLAIRALALFRGKTGIRTLEPFLTTTRFPDVPLQPLEHLS